MDLTGVRLVGEATCDTGSGPFTRVYELETPVPLPEPSFATASLLGALGLSLGASRRKRGASH